MVQLSDLFDEFLSRISPTEWELDRARVHRDEVTRRLPELEGFKEAINTGSYIRGTSLHPFTDIDVFLGYDPDSYDGDAERLITRLHWHLGRSFPNSTVRLQSHSVGVIFSDDIRVDVVPGLAVNGRPGFYRVRDREKNIWSTTNVRGHKDFFDRAQARDPRFRDIVRCVKAWKNSRRTKFSSYMLELLVTRAFRGRMPQGKDVILHDFFQWLSLGGFPWPAKVPDPTNSANNVASDLTRPAHLELLSAANYARARIGTALRCTSRHQASIALGDVFDQFPVV